MNAHTHTHTHTHTHARAVTPCHPNNGGLRFWLTVVWGAIRDHNKQSQLKTDRAHRLSGGWGRRREGDGMKGNDGKMEAGRRSKKGRERRWGKRKNVRKDTRCYKKRRQWEEGGKKWGRWQERGTGMKKTKIHNHLSPFPNPSSSHTSLFFPFFSLLKTFPLSLTHSKPAQGSQMWA